MVKYLSNIKVNKNRYYNLSITGSPGVGKTILSKIIVKIYKTLGITYNDKIYIGNTEKMISQYIGETTIKTNNFLKSAKGGIVFIDEIYSMSENQRECVNAINNFISENIDTIFIICGYKHDVNEYFFKKNIGLYRRFPWNFHIEDYTHIELCDIFIKNLDDHDIKKNEVIDLFKHNIKYFNGNAGDVLHLIDKCEMCKFESPINYIKRGFDIFIKMKLNMLEVEYEKIYLTSILINNNIDKRKLIIGYDLFYEDYKRFIENEETDKLKLKKGKTELKSILMLFSSNIKFENNNIILLNIDELRKELNIFKLNESKQLEYII